MLRLILTACTVICFAGCIELGEEPVDVKTLETNRPLIWDDDANVSSMSGETAYRFACASCHETGEKDAPLTSNRDAWRDRSPLWVAVLADHAKNGYMEMPAKGGVAELPDAVVGRASEYMMMLVYPDRASD